VVKEDPMSELEIDEATQKVIDNFDEHAKRRCAELLGSSVHSAFRSMLERAFCLGYKAGVVDHSAVVRASANRGDAR
jgi:hypothetical protein